MVRQQVRQRRSTPIFIGRGIWITPWRWKAVPETQGDQLHPLRGLSPPGELKHGTISLVENGTLVVGILTQQDLFEKTCQQHGRVSRAVALT